MNNTKELQDFTPPGEATRAYNIAYAKRLKNLAWVIEIVLVTVGLGIAFAQVASTPEGSGFIQMFPVFGVFVILAVIELAKIPAATIVYHARGRFKVLPMLGLLVVSLISFETIFNGFERYATLTTQPVIEAKADLEALKGDKARLLSAPLAEETDGSRVAALDATRVEEQRASVSVYQAAAERARANLDSEETKELKAQLQSLTDQQEKAGNDAKTAWKDEQDSILSRLGGTAIDARMRKQLNNRMHAMPSLQSAVNAARAKFDTQIAKVNASIEASITAPSPEALAILQAAEARLKNAQDQLSDYEVAAAERADRRIENQQVAEQAARKRADEIKAIDALMVTQNRAVAQTSAGSQMHRWAAFAYGVDAVMISDEQVKRTSAVFGMILAIAGALTGASVAMYSEWFRTRGITPKIIEKEVPIEVIVEKEVEKIVEIEVPTIKYKYVPVPIGDDMQESVDGILKALPEAAANELRAQLATSATPKEVTQEKPYARAA